MFFSKPTPSGPAKGIVEVTASLVKSQTGLSALGPFKPDSWKVVDAACRPFGVGDVIRVVDSATGDKTIVNVGRIRSWELGWVKFAVGGAGSGVNTHLYAPLDIIRLGFWDQFLHWCRSPWLGDTVTGYFAPTALSLEASCHQKMSPMSEAKARGVTSLELVEDGYGPYRVY